MTLPRVRFSHGVDTGIFFSSVHVKMVFFFDNTIYRYRGAIMFQKYVNRASDLLLIIFSFDDEYDSILAEIY